MATGDADQLAALLVSQQPSGAGLGTLTAVAQQVDRRFEFLRGMDNCVQGVSFDTNWSEYRQRGFKAGQTLGLFDVWP